MHFFVKKFTHTHSLAQTCVWHLNFCCNICIHVCLCTYERICVCEHVCILCKDITIYMYVYLRMHTHMVKFVEGHNPFAWNAQIHTKWKIWPSEPRLCLQAILALVVSLFTLVFPRNSWGRHGFRNTHSHTHTCNIHICMYVCLCIYVHAHIYMHIYTCMCVFVYMYICVYNYIS